MNAHDDRDLKDAFEALGGLEQAGVPSFGQFTSREALAAARGRRRRERAGSALLVVAALIPAIMTLRAVDDGALDYERFTALTGLDLSEVTWEAPSDFLLEFPGRELLRGVPLIQTQAPVPPDSVRSSDSTVTKGRSRS